MNTGSNPTFLTPCPEWAEQLAATHPDDLSLVERQRLQAHLATCPTCTAIRAEYERMGTRISELPSIDPGPGLPPALLHLLSASTPRSRWTPPSQEEQSRSSVLPTLPSMPAFHNRERQPRLILQTLAAVLIVGALLGSFLVLFASHHTETAQPGKNGYTKTWHIIPSPNAGSQGSFLSDITALSATDAWAVGHTSISASPSTTRTLIEHWNGTRWSIVPSPNTSEPFNWLDTIIAHSSNDIWAIGADNTTTGDARQPLFEHWNGQQWSILNIPAPIQRPNMQTNILEDYAFISPDNIWGFGASRDTYGHYSMTLIEHWNGTQWSIVPSPNPGASRNELYGAVALSANNIWTVGRYDYGNSDTLAQTLIEHWNGSKWSIVPTPPIDTNDNYLNSISATSASDIWAAGISSSNIFSTTGQPLIEHWNGTTWSVVNSQTIGVSDDFYKIIALAPGNVWGFGTSYNTATPQQNDGQSFLLHWDGDQWSVVPPPTITSGMQVSLATVAPIPGSNRLWAVGYSYRTNSQQMSTFTALYY